MLNKNISRILKVICKNILEFWYDFSDEIGNYVDLIIHENEIDGNISRSSHIWR